MLYKSNVQIAHDNLDMVIIGQTIRPYHIYYYHESWRAGDADLLAAYPDIELLSEIPKGIIYSKFEVNNVKDWFRRYRDWQLANLYVEVDGIKIDTRVGKEDRQNLLDAASALVEGQSMKWVCYNNDRQILTRDQIVRAEANIPMAKFRVWQRFNDAMDVIE